jgi:4'-phosphopantetheinyl transferase
MRGLICHFSSQDEVPEDLGWLGLHEREHLLTLSRTRRRGEWLLGRWTAKQALLRDPESDFDGQELDELEIRPDSRGAPNVYLRNVPLPISISLSHRGGAGFCALYRGGSVGCDLEWIETRSDGFIEDYFTPRERALIESGDEDLRALQANAFWSAKESVMKVLGVGLTVDTRSIEIEDTSDLPIRREWGGYRALSQSEDRRFHGWWRQQDRWILTVALEAESPRPLEV